MKLFPTAILGWLIFGSIGTLSLVLAILSVRRGAFLTAVAALGMTAFCFGLVVPLWKRLSGKVIPRIVFDDEGTTFRPDPGMDIPVHVSMFGLVVASTLLAVLAPLGKLDIPIPPFMRYSLPFTSLVIVATGAPTLWRNFRRGSSRYLRLTPGGFDLIQGWRPQRGDWEDVRDVTDSVPGQQTSSPSAVVLVMSNDSAPSLVAGAITPNGVALRDLVRFYWQHPDQRDELTDGRAIERLAQFQDKSS